METWTFTHLGSKRIARSKAVESILGRVRVCKSTHVKQDNTRKLPLPIIHPICADIVAPGKEKRSVGSTTCGIFPLDLAWQSPPCPLSVSQT
jgi:hypothetical protein